MSFANLALGAAAADSTSAYATPLAPSAAVYANKSVCKFRIADFLLD
jgi:hypothetical protein